ncbi:hypothetical protein TNCV_1246881 [Trichonephila clavipes]|uniref:Uncharacterized protein n=1 Tax=Trichonephila clavipes TaxID=2585209 RepID=A0A8X6UXB0_TRICX|nr:hypothetical protein TNCV_1246881 [Trichonephila clavipes]
MAFTSRVSLPGENYPDILHPYHPAIPIRHIKTTERTSKGPEQPREYQTAFLNFVSDHIKSSHVSSESEDISG